MSIETSKKSYILNLSSETYEYYKKIGLKRHFTKNENIRHRGFAKKKEDPYEGYPHVKGILGEYYYSNWSGLKIDLNLFKNHGDISDFEGIEIKTSSYQYHDIDLKIESIKEFNKCILNNIQAVFLIRIRDGFIKNGNNCILELIGWNPIKRFKYLAIKNGPKQYIKPNGPINYINFSKDLNLFLPEEGHKKILEISKKDNYYISQIEKCNTSEEDKQNIIINYINTISLESLC